MQPLEDHILEYHLHVKHHIIFFHFKTYFMNPAATKQILQLSSGISELSLATSIKLLILVSVILFDTSSCR